MRSSSMAWLAGQLDLPVLLLEGGYKGFRRWVLERFEQAWPLHLLGGRTGCGKTELLLALAQRGVAVVDLEGLAHHRGSSFGGWGCRPSRAVSCSRTASPSSSSASATPSRSGWRPRAPRWAAAGSPPGCGGR